MLNTIDMTNFELIQKENTAPILMVLGRLDAVSSASFEVAVEPLLSTTNFLVIDIGQCNYISSTGIRILLISHKKMLAAKGKLFITGVLPEIFQVFEMVGLHTIFNIVDSPELAVKEIVQLQSDCAEPMPFNWGNKSFQFQKICKQSTPLLCWSSNDMLGCHELGLSIAYGASAESDDTDNLSYGLVVTAGACAGFMPNDRNIPADFRVASDPANIAVLSQGAVSFGEQPSGVVTTKEEQMTLPDCIAACKQAKVEQQASESMLMVVLNRDPEHPSLSFVLDIDIPEDTSELWKCVSLLHKNIMPEGGSADSIGLTFMLEKLPRLDDASVLSNFLADLLTIDNIIAVESLSTNANLHAPIAWLFLTHSIEDAAARLLIIDTKSELILEPYQRFLIRKLYADASRVIIEPLHGGYSAQTLQVTSFDKDGRKLRPTVLKLANRAMITRESKRCQQYALPYIFNNSAAVLGTAFHGDKGALVYNFVGIGGEDSRLKWLTHYFHQEEMEMLEPLFDKIFRQILKPWYGQPVETTIYPFKDHDPTLTFFPHIYQSVNEFLSVNPDDQHITITEIGRPLLNPYWFLKHEFPKRREQGMPYFEGICHGDLNMQNILLDEAMNVYLIDFSETKPRSAISDFARLEAIFLCDNAPLENQDDWDTYVQYITDFYSLNTLSDVPSFAYTGQHPKQVQKQVDLALKMRQYAVESAQGNSDITPYYLALLEWVLPIVCYGSSPVLHKRLSMIVCGLLCERIYKRIQ
jgi:anti-anti-sigma factor